MKPAPPGPRIDRMGQAPSLGRMETSEQLPVSLAQALAILTAAFRQSDLDTPGLDARRLLTGVLQLADTALLGEPERTIAPDDMAKLVAAARRRLAHEPVSRIVSQRHFHGLAFDISPATLDPRPDTETLVEGVLALIAQGRVPGGQAPRILDLGTGSGAIAIACLKQLPNAHAMATDQSQAALEVAQRNAAKHGVSDRVRLKQADWFAGVDGQFDIVISNPPYIPSRDIPGLAPEVRDHDPLTALDGGESGLEAYEAIAKGLPSVLAPGGWIAVEVGAGQHEDVAAILHRACPGLEFKIEPWWRDLSDRPRCVAAKARD
ncbi:MAG: peptide chain release factor N(5)-glutamine methyltransferase [Hyphomicrobiaceae bacterium]